MTNSPLGPKHGVCVVVVVRAALMCDPVAPVAPVLPTGPVAPAAAKRYNS